MSDLISRAEAMDAIHNLYAIHGSEGSWIDQKDAFKALNSLPSAQPTVDAIPVIRCKDCKYSDTFSDMTAEPHSQLKCLGIRYGGVEPMWYCEHGERKEE